MVEIIGCEGLIQVSFILLIDDLSLEILVVDRLSGCVSLSFAAASLRLIANERTFPIAATVFEAFGC